MNFKITEDTTPRYSDKFDEFVELYNNSDLTVIEIRKRLDWSLNIYTQAMKVALSKNLITLRGNRSSVCRKKKKFSPKYYTQDVVTGKYSIRKHIGGCTEYFGSYDSEETVRAVVKKLKLVNWDKKEFPIIKEECVRKYGS